MAGLAAPLPAAPAAPARTPRRLAHRRAAGEAAQQVWIVFGGRADMPWMRWLPDGFRHCFAAIAEADGWLVLDPLSGRLVATRLPAAPGFDLPRFYRRAGFRVLGPFRPGPARARLLPGFWPMTCVGLCRAVLGAGAPFALTPRGLHDRLSASAEVLGISS